MKNIIIILLLCVIGYGFWQMQSQNKNAAINQAKNELGIQETNSQAQDLPADSTDSPENASNKTTDDSQSEQETDVNNGSQPAQEEVVEQQEEKIEVFQVNYLTEEKFLTFDEFDTSDLTDGEIEITGSTLETVDSIRVLFQNRDSEYPNDDYTLGQFKSGDTTFLYRAFSQYQVFDFGKNVYTFVATSGDREAKVELIIHYIDPAKKTTQDTQAQSEETISSDEINISTLPTGAAYGTPKKVGDGKITYSDLKGFELSVSNNNISECSSDVITKAVGEITGTWSWWNTCVTNTDKTQTSVYALSMKDGEYKYVKVYFSQNYTATIQLTSGVDEAWNSFENISDKNTWLKEKNNELKQENQSFEILTITDNLFTQITQ